MNQLVQLLGQVAQWIWQNPQISLRVLYSCKRAYDGLSPANKARVDRIIRWGGEMLLKHALPDVLGDVGQQVVAAVGNEQVAEFAKAVVTRGAEVGIEKALEEAHRG